MRCLPHQNSFYFADAWMHGLLVLSLSVLHVLYCSLDFFGALYRAPPFLYATPLFATSSNRQVKLGNAYDSPIPQIFVTIFTTACKL